MIYGLEGIDMLFIWYPKCSTCQKAKKWLDSHEIEYTERHIVEENPTYEELKECIRRAVCRLRSFSILAV